MSLLSSILSQIANGLDSDGAQFSPHTIEALATEMAFLETLNRPLDDPVAIAAYATSLLKPEAARCAAVALGASEDLIPTLDEQNPVIPIISQLGRVLGRGSPEQAAVAATVLFAFHARAARRGDDKHVRALREIADIATLDGSLNIELAKTLVLEMEKIPVAPASAPPSCDAIFSISIDLVGSTDAKKRVMDLAQGDCSKIDRFNERIYGEFCRIEQKFYEYAVASYGPAGPIDPSRFFVVKGIGDEIWILCHVTEQDIFSVGHNLIDTSIRVTADLSVNFFATEHEEGPAFNQNFDHGRTEHIKSPIKIFVDLVSHASNLGRIRDEGLMRAIPNLLRTFHGREPKPAEIATVARELCLSAYEPVGFWRFHQYRTDYIGHEIDRFFRTTKAARPATVTIGDSMVRKMRLAFEHVKGDVYAVCAPPNTPLMGGLPVDPVYACKQTLTKKKMKGVGYDYDTYTLFAPRSLNGIYVMMAKDRKNGLPVLPCKTTQKLIPRNVVQKLATQLAGT